MGLNRGVQSAIDTSLLYDISYLIRRNSSTTTPELPQIINYPFFNILR